MLMMQLPTHLVLLLICSMNVQRAVNFIIAQESEAIARSLRELCIHATIPLPPELEGPISSDHISINSELNTSGASHSQSGALSLPAPASDAAAAATAAAKSLAEAKKFGSAPSGDTRNAAAAAAVSDASLEPQAAESGAKSGSDSGLQGPNSGSAPVVIAVAPPIAAGVESGDPQAIALAATAAATAVLASKVGVQHQADSPLNEVRPRPAQIWHRGSSLQCTVPILLTATVLPL